MRKIFGNSLTFVAICFTSLAFALAYLFARGIVSPRTLGIGLTVLVAGLFVLIALRLRKRLGSSKSEAPLQFSKSGSVMILQIAVAALPLILVLGLFLTRGEPLVPRLAGAALNVLFTCCFISILRGVKRKSR